MASPAPGPALPWGAPTDAGVAPDIDGARAAGEADAGAPALAAAEQLGLALGARVEVLWTVHGGESTSYDRWWGATIEPVAPQSPASTSGAVAGPQYTLRYDPAPAEGFDEEEIARVAVLADHRLLDLASGDVMVWRREGEAYEQAEEEEEGEEGEEGAGAERTSVTMAELAAGITDADVAEEEAGLAAALAAAGPAGRDVAAGYRDFVDGLKAFIAAKASSGGEGGEGVTITKADMEEFKAIMMTAQRARTARG
ncbi:hypothetical protein HT031_006457 [Scenedesmus sp. PABB004]|nr:hypothetical protein HT031_006457 [Scenedesmus sp. PABB004]